MKIKTKMTIKMPVKLIKTWQFFGWAIVFGVFFVSAVLFNIQKNNIPDIKSIENLRYYSLEEIKSFNGVDENKPIYLVYNGAVYDVTSEKEFYGAGGPYHHLAGRDSSKELNLIGGSIIKKKYSVIGLLSK